MAQNWDSSYITRTQQNVPNSYPTQGTYSRSVRKNNFTSQDRNYNLSLGSRPPPPSGATTSLYGQPHSLGSTYRSEAPMQANQWPLKDLRARSSDASHQQPCYPGGRPFDAIPQTTRPRPLTIQDQGSQQSQSSLYPNQYGPYDQPGEPDGVHQYLPSASTFRDLPPAEHGIDSSPYSRRKGPLVAPPPLSRRGLQSLYSGASHVSPIPEESFRSYGSHASSAAIPGTWGPIHAEEDHSNSRGTFYEESINEHDADECELGDDDNLVRSASVGKKGKPSIIVTRSPSNASTKPRHSVAPLQPLTNGSQALQFSGQSCKLLHEAAKPHIMLPSSVDHKDQASTTPEVTLVMEEKAESHDTSASEFTTERTGRLATRRPAKLDLDAVRTAEARGSLTSLPDLIKRATRLAAMIDGGKRPASRVDNISMFLDEKIGSEDKIATQYRHRSGLSDMLNAFPAPADRTSRKSWFRNTSWPHVSDRNEIRQESNEKPRGRQCCGIPAWLFVLMWILLLCIVATAIVIPLEIYVFKNLGTEGSQGNLGQCKDTLRCQNGGINYAPQGMCACICLGGYMGSDCSDRGVTACTTTTVSKTDGSSSTTNATLGDAIPRIISDANNAFSVPLSGVDVLAKFNVANLSCAAQNSLVTLSNHSSAADDSGHGKSKSGRSANRSVSGGQLLPTAVVTVTSTIVAVARRDDGGKETAVNTEQLVIDTSAPPEAPFPTATPTETDSAPYASYTVLSLSDTFNMTDETLDFAKVAILYVLQETDLDGADYAQRQLQDFFTGASHSQGIPMDMAKGVTIGVNMTVNLVDFLLDLGNGEIGRS